MTQLEKIKAWLQTYPAWEDSILVNFTEDRPGNTGVFPTGAEELSRREDVLGNLQVEYRYSFDLRRQVACSPDSTANAQWLLDFQAWVQQQSACGLTPHFGDVPSRERMQVRGGMLKAVSPMGTGTYIVTLMADFIKVYEVK